MSELSHKLGSAEGAKRSLEEESARLQAAHKAASQQRHELDIQLNEAKAKLIALEEKVGGGWRRAQGAAVLHSWAVREAYQGLITYRNVSMAGIVALTESNIRMMACSAAHLLLLPLFHQAQAQAGIIEQQQLRLRDLEGSARQWEARCSDLRDVLAGHEQRAKEAAAEVLKGNQIIEKLSVSSAAVAQVWPAPLHALQSAAVSIACPLHTLRNTLRNSAAWLCTMSFVLTLHPPSMHMTCCYYGIAC